MGVYVLHSAAASRQESFERHLRAVQGIPQSGHPRVDLLHRLAKGLHGRVAALPQEEAL